MEVGAKGGIHKIIRRLAKEGLAVLLISRDLPEVLGVSDRIAVRVAPSSPNFLTLGNGFFLGVPVQEWVFFAVALWI